MKVSLTIYSLVYLLVISIGVSIGLYFLLAKKEARFSMLGTFFLLFSCLLLEDILMHESYFDQHPEFLFLPIFIPILMPFVYGAFCASVNQPDKNWKSWVLMPIAVQVLALIIAYFSADDFKRMIWEEKKILMLIGMVSLVFNVFFLIKSIGVGVDEDSIDESNNLPQSAENEFLEVLKVIGGLFCGFIFMRLVTLLLPNEFSFLSYWASVGLALFLVYYSTYKVLIAQTNIEQDQMKEEVNLGQLIPLINNQMESDSMKAFRLISNFMMKEKPYLEPNLSLNQLATLMNMNKRKLSELIKESTGLNFNRFVNAYRVTEAMENLNSAEKDEISVVGIGYESGFNSKASFFSTFKSFTGMPPAEFRRLRREGKTNDEKGNIFS